MKLNRFRQLLDAYGADPARWPEAERAEALALLARSRRARDAAEAARALDRLLDRAPPPHAALDADALAAGITVAMQPRASRAERPGGWTLSLGWPNLTALAAAALAGFIVGWSGLDATFRYDLSASFEEPADGGAVGEEALW